MDKSVDMPPRAPSFGHHTTNARGVHLDAWGAGPLLIRSRRRRWWFEFSDMFGPLLLRPSDLEPSVRQPVSERDPFWVAFNAWMRAGRKCRAVRDKRGRLRFWVCHAPRRELLR